MKRVLRIIGIVLLVLLAGIVILLFCLSKRPAVPTDYQIKTETGGELEANYMASGKYEVSTYEESVLQGFGKYILFYPSGLTEKADAYPVIVISNGSGTPLSKYPAVAKHFASWGFIVIGTEERYDWDGFSSEMCIRYLKRLNESKTIGEEKDNIFFGKIDLENVGIVGHSQGGVGVLNAVTAQPHSAVFKTAVSLSPTNKEMAHNLMWDYNAAKVSIPILLVAGAGGGDDWVVTGEQLEEIYNDIGSDKIMLRRKDTVHNEVLYTANGYVTAWFMWQLQGDESAAAAFTGDSPEMMRNKLYQDQQISFGSEQIWQ
ncbi:MAG: hypothetical protein ACI4ME_08710 [Aristaeellaceae bacterium]